MACICGRSQALYLIAYEIFNWQMLSTAIQNSQQWYAVFIFLSR